MSVHSDLSQILKLRGCRIHWFPTQILYFVIAGVCWWTNCWSCSGIRDVCCLANELIDNAFIDFQTRGLRPPSHWLSPIPGLTHPEKSFPAEMDTQKRWCCWWWWWWWWWWRWWWWWSWWGWRWWTRDTNFQEKVCCSVFVWMIQGTEVHSLVIDCYRPTFAFRFVVWVCDLTSPLYLGALEVMSNVFFADETIWIILSLSKQTGRSRTCLETSVSKLCNILSTTRTNH